MRGLSGDFPDLSSASPSEADMDDFYRSRLADIAAKNLRASALWVAGWHASPVNR